MIIQFTNVGPAKQSWQAELPDAESVTLYREVKRQKCLGSRGIDFDFDETEQLGRIYVGGFRCVGFYSIIDRHVETIPLNTERRQHARQSNHHRSG
jgi:hypothetical protein